MTDRCRQRQIRDQQKTKTKTKQRSMPPRNGTSHSRDTQKHNLITYEYLYVEREFTFPVPLNLVDIITLWTHFLFSQPGASHHIASHRIAKLTKLRKLSILRSALEDTYPRPSLGPTLELFSRNTLSNIAPEELTPRS